MSKNLILKLWYRIFNKSKYQHLKHKNNLSNRLNYYNSHIYDKIIEIEKNINSNTELNFLHSGHLGDIMYSLPAIKELSKTHKCKLYIQADKPMEVDYQNHPSGKVYLDKRIVNLLLPLLQQQTFLNSVNIYNNEKIDVNLDLFRKMPINIRFHSVRWYSHLTGVHVNMHEPCLFVKPHKLVKNKIVIVRSPRYRNSYINYEFLKNTKNLVCVGLKSEFEDLKKEIHNLEFYDCKDFLEMAEIIKGSKFFIGNECFAYSIAESLKIPRLLEASPDFPVVFPASSNGYDFYHQNHFEKLFKNLSES